MSKSRCNKRRKPKSNADNPALRSAAQSAVQKRKELADKGNTKAAIFWVVSVLFVSNDKDYAALQAQCERLIKAQKALAL